MIKIKEIINSIFTSKTYILFCEGCEKAWLVDIGDIEPVVAFLQENRLKVGGVFLTHAHFDHIYGLPELVKHYPCCNVYVTEYAKEGLSSDMLNLSRYHETPVTYEGDNVLVVHEGENMSLFYGEPPIEFYETPGHNPGCLTMVLGEIIFTGDAYIPGVGANTQLPHANKVQAQQSMERILKLAEGKTILSGHKVEMLPLLDLLWMATLQVVVTKDKNALIIKNWGSGFLFGYRKKLFFVTADHVAHFDDFVAGERLGKDDFVWVFNGRNQLDQLTTMVNPINGIYSFDLFNLDDVLPEIPELKDMAFAILEKPIEPPLLTLALKDLDGTVLVPAGEDRLYLEEKCVAELKDGDICYVGSCVKWDISGVMLNYQSLVHRDLVLTEVNSDGYYVFKYHSPVVVNEWRGISGAPVFNQQGDLIGMLIEVDENYDTVTVVPMKTIMRLMDYAIKHEETIN